MLTSSHDFTSLYVKICSPTFNGFAASQQPEKRLTPVVSVLTLALQHIRGQYAFRFICFWSLCVQPSAQSVTFDESAPLTVQAFYLGKTQDWQQDCQL